MPEETYYPQEQERKKQAAKAKIEAANNNTGEALFDDRPRLNESQAVASVQRESIE